MEKLFSTYGVHPRERFSYWHSAACRSLVDHDSEPHSRHDFHAEIDAGTLGDIGLVLLANSPMQVTRTRRNVARGPTDDLFVCCQLEGELALEQEGREVSLQPGHMALLDPMLPYHGNFLTESRVLVLKLQRRDLEARTGRTRGMVARSLKPSGAESGLTSSFLALLPGYAGRLGPVAEAMTRDQSLDLIALSLAEAMEGNQPQLSSPKMAALLSLRAAIDVRLADPSLDAKTVAGAAGLSVRYANAVLSKVDTSISSLVRERRLARCRKALGDPLQAHRTLTEIAYGWGFSDMTHFGRAFKRAYGMLPSAYRQACKTSDPDGAAHARDTLRACPAGQRTRSLSTHSQFPGTDQMRRRADTSCTTPRDRTDKCSSPEYAGCPIGITKPTKSYHAPSF